MSPVQAVPAPIHVSEPASSAGVRHIPALSNLRVFLVLLVLAHHAVLAYHPFAPQPAASLATPPQWWPAFPVVDAQRWSGFALLVGFNDLFFMSLLFFLSGLFVWSSVQRKGVAGFCRDRFLRLGLPFAIGAGVLAPLAYFPSYLQTSAQASFSEFCRQWLSIGMWPAGPVWFIWVLLIFDVAAVVLLSRVPLGRIKRWREASVFRRPSALFAALIAASAAVYIPMAIVFSPLQWTAFGPFAFQTSRIFHYLAYFLFGVAVGVSGIESSAIVSGGMLAKRWPRWMSAAILAFIMATIAAIATFSSGGYSVGWSTMNAVLFVVSCAASSFAFLALFLRFAPSASRVWDSLNAASYGIYLVHYAVVSWLQFALLGASAPAAAKGFLVFAGTLLASWGAVASARRLPIVRRVI